MSTQAGIRMTFETCFDLYKSVIQVVSYEQIKFHSLPKRIWLCLSKQRNGKSNIIFPERIRPSIFRKTQSTVRHHDVRSLDCVREFLTTLPLVRQHLYYVRVFEEFSDLHNCTPLLSTFEGSRPTVFT